MQSLFSYVLHNCKDTYFLTDFVFFCFTWASLSVVFLALFLYVLTDLTSSSTKIGASIQLHVFLE